MLPRTGTIPVICFDSLLPASHARVWSLQGCGSEVQHQINLVRAGENHPALMEDATVR